MLTRTDSIVELYNTGTFGKPFFSGMRPTIKISGNCTATGLLEFEGTINDNEKSNARVQFISPKYISNSLWIDKELDIMDGAKVIGSMKVLEIVNPILDCNKEKWVLLDGREIHTIDDFYKLIQLKLTDNSITIGKNLNALNDILWGGFGVHDYEIPLHIVWIYAKESENYLGSEKFNSIISVFEEHESNNIFLEKYDEHAKE